MKIGYACLTVSVPGTDIRGCIAKNANNENLYDIISMNLDSLMNILIYNVKNGIRLFRISSDLIPFSSSVINKLEWQKIFKSRFFEIGEYIRNNQLRVSMHPGQYTVLNSLNEDVAKRAVDDLLYHCDVLDLMECDNSCKIILHIGGAYDNKQKAIERFKENYIKLDARIKKRLIIENDDRIFNISEVLDIANQLKIPVVYDNLHNYANPYDESITDLQWIKQCSSTWTKMDGNQKIHYSEQDKGKKAGSHSQTISLSEFLHFYQNISSSDADIMLEVKDKNISAVKCINAVSDKRKISALEDEWARYKYSVLEKSHKHYLEIRNLIKDKNSYPVMEFYSLIEEALKMQGSVNSSINAFEHVWGYFKDKADDKEKKKIQALIENYKSGTSVNIENDSIKVKSFLMKLSEKYNEAYLLNSYYFYLQ
ncbi:MAG TPA: UV DNA damage repair endonuclease UvsE [Clostridia bacterium]|nr:UV DNA damage repair endonuclease UvsE [Clostridia bacterium]